MRGEGRDEGKPSVKRERGEGREQEREWQGNQFSQVRQTGHKSQQGFTLLELMVVVTIAGILATLAEPSFRQSVLRAKEAALKQNLFTMRDVIDQYRADTGSYPPSLAELTSAGYLRGIPVDPFTKSDSAWTRRMPGSSMSTAAASSSQLTGRHITNGKKRT